MQKRGVGWIGRHALELCVAGLLLWMACDLGRRDLGRYTAVVGVTKGGAQIGMVLDPSNDMTSTGQGKRMGRPWEKE